MSGNTSNIVFRLTSGHSIEVGSDNIVGLKEVLRFYGRFIAVVKLSPKEMDKRGVAMVRRWFNKDNISPGPS